MGRREAARPSLDVELLERVLEPGNMRRAWRQVKANKGAPGVDGVTVDDWPKFARMEYESIREAVRDGSYRPKPVRRVTIPKPKGGERLLGIPTVTDRVLQQAIAQVLMPIFDPEFSESSFGYRPGRSAHEAVREVLRHNRAGGKFAVDLDLEKFFDRVDHDRLMARLSRKIADRRLLKLIGRILRAGVRKGEQVHPTRQGVPQGGPLSPLLSNVVLDELDRELEQRGHRFVRYADDVVIFVKSRRAGERVQSSVTRFLQRRLRLAVNEGKSRVVRTVVELTYLGFSFKGGKLRWSDETLARFKRRVRELTGRNWGVSMDYRLLALRRYLIGWMNYFGISQYYRPIPELDGWIRRRVRMCYWRQWRRFHTRVRKLLSLGAFRGQALATAKSSKGPWRLARTLATNHGMSNKWLAEQGLVSLKTQWSALHYPR